MQVTDVRVRRVEKEGKMKAIVSITMDNEFVIHDIKVIEGEKGLFIAIQHTSLEKDEMTLLENEGAEAE